MYRQKVIIPLDDQRVLHVFGLELDELIIRKEKAP